MDQLDLLKEITDDIIKDDYIEYDNIENIKNLILLSIENIIDNPNYELINYNLNKMLKCVFIINDDYDDKIIYNKKDIIIPDKYKKLVNHVDMISKLPQPEQRSKEWFDMRKNMLTASIAGKITSKSKYGSPKAVIRDKLGLGDKFVGNIYTQHGVKYEEIATKIYENAYNIKVDEYGLIPHLPEPRISFIGASPDGIASMYKLDNSFSKRLGRMLEIKCPYSRKIKTEGKVDGIICPHHYWCQVQQQLECCDLKKCDFWQCNIKEFNTKEEWLNDNTVSKNTQEQNKELYIPEKCLKGMIIQLYPINKIEEKCFLDCKYIYPDDINMSSFEYDMWILKEIQSLHINYPNHVFDRILYWKLIDSHNVVIKRDREWFQENLPKYKELWDKVISYRENPREQKKLIKPIKNDDIRVSSDSEEDICVDSD